MRESIQQNLKLMCKTNIAQTDAHNQSNDQSLEIKQLYNMLNNSGNSQRTVMECDIALFEDQLNLNNQSESYFLLHEKRVQETKLITKKLEKMQKLEVSRLMKEFKFRNYEKNHQTTHYKVFSILWGVKVATTELIRNQLLGAPIVQNKEQSQ
eukprot:TRINITY_DN17038_c0_g1_i1.p1 TRINITY_DN17038_c0_g1~~TRINITY_DN17038_c0_g1_i1.p1  ORF type:complete len:153 (-),score=24.08 TRINITY_DN17038_c0_g1_i1:23-481(-)